MARLCLALLLAVLLQLSWQQALTPDDTSENFVLPPCSEKQFFITHTYGPLDFQEINLNTFNSTNNDYLEMRVTNDGPVGDLVTLPTCTTQGTNKCTTEVTCDLQDSGTWFIYVTNRQDEPVRFNVTTFSSTVKTTTLTLGTGQNFTTNLEATNFGNRYAFYQVGIQPPSEFANATFTIKPYTQNGIQNVIINPFELAAPQTDCSLTSFVPEQDDEDDALVLDSCALQPYQGSNVWYISIQTVPNVNVTFEILVEVNDPTVTILEVPTTTKIQFINKEDIYQFFSIDAPPPPATDTDVQQQLQISVLNVQGGTVEFSYAYKYLPWLMCRDTDYTVCTTDSRCDVIVPSCELQDGTYYLGVYSKSLLVQNQPLAYQLSVSYADPPNTSIATSLTDGSYATDFVAQNDYQHYKFKAGDYKTTGDTWLNVLLYVDSTDVGPTTLFVNHDTLATSDYDCFGNFRSCEIEDVGSCIVQVFSCDYSDHDSWYVSVLGGNTTGIYYGKGTRFSLVATLQDPQEVKEPEIIYFGKTYYEQYNHYYLSDDRLDFGGAIELEIASVSGGNVRVYVNQDQLAGDNCATQACYDSVSSYNASPVSDVVVPFARCSDDSDDDEETFFSILGTSDVDTATTYTVTLLPSYSPRTPLSKLKKREVMVDRLTDVLPSKNYSISDSGSSKRLIVTVSLLEDVDGASITATLYSTQYLNCLGFFNNAGTCTTTSGSSYCTIVLEPCVFEANSKYSVVITGTEDVLYNVVYDVQSVSTTTLKNGVAVAGEVLQNQPSFFKYSASAKNTTLVVETYFDGASGVGVTLSSSVGSQGGAPPCYGTAAQTCTSSTKCVFTVNACDLEKATYYFTLSADSAALSLASPPLFTIRASEIDAIVEQPYDEVVPMSIYNTQKVYHSFSVDTWEPEDGQIVDIYVGSVQGGSVNVFLAETSPLATCPCFKYLQSLTVAENTEVAILSVPYCEIQFTGNWTLEVVGVNVDTPASEISYSLTIHESISTPVDLAPSTPASSSLANNQYDFYKLSGIEQYDSFIVEITDVSEGSVTAYYRDTYPAISRCSVGTICQGTTTSCAQQVGACEGKPEFISIRAVANNADPVKYTLNINISPITQLTLKTPENVQLETGFSKLYSFQVPTDSKGPVIRIDLANIDNPPVRVSALQAACGGSEFDTLCAGEECVLYIGNCDVTSDQWYLSITSLATAGNTTLDLGATVQETAINVLDIPANGVQSTLAPFQWRIYTVPVDFSKHPNTSIELDVAATANVTDALYVYSTFVDDDTPYASIGCADRQCSGVLNCAIQYTSCCIRNGSYSIAVRNNLNQNLDYTLSATIVDVAKYFTIDVNTTVSDITLAPQEYEEYRLFLEDKNYPSQYSWLEFVTTAENVNNTDQFAFYMQQVSDAGSTTDDCFTNVFQCLTPSSCTYQVLQCRSRPVIGTWSLAMTPFDDDDTDLSVSLSANIREPIYTPIVDENDNGTLYHIDDGSLVAYHVFDITNYTDSLHQLVVQVSQPDGLLESRLRLALDVNSMCNLESTNFDCVSSFAFGQECSLTLPLCNSPTTVLASVTEIQVDSSNYTLKAYIEEFDTITFETGTTEYLGQSNGFTYWIADLSNVTVAETTEMSLKIKVDGGEVSQVNLAYSTDFCFSSVDQCEQTTPGDVCSFHLAACELVSDQMLTFRLQLSSVPLLSDANVTVTYALYENAEPTPLEFNGGVVSGEVELYEEAFFEIDLSDVTLETGQSVEFVTETLCGVVSHYVNDGSSLAELGCQIPCTGDNCLANSFSLDACTVSRYGLPDTLYATVYGAQQDQSEYNIPIYFTVESYTNSIASLPTRSLTFRLVQAGERIEYNATEHLDTVFVYPIDGLGDSAGSTIFEYNGAEGSTLRLSFDSPSFCGITSGVNCASGENCIISSCTVNKHRNIFFEFDRASPAGTFVQIVRVAPYVRDWNAVSGGLSTPQSGLVGSSDAEHYQFTVDPTSIDFFQLTITLSNVAGGTASFAYSTSGPPGQGIGCPVPTTCTSQNGVCTLTIDACDITSEIHYVSVLGGTTLSTASYTLSITTDVPHTSIKELEEICVTIPPESFVWFEATTSTFDDERWVDVRVRSVEQTGVTMYLNAAVDSKLAVPLANDNCNRLQQTCSTTTGCLVRWPCVVNGSMAIGLYNSAASTNTMFLRWDYQPNGLLVSNDTTYSAASTLDPVFLKTTQLHTNLSSTEVMVASVTQGDDNTVLAWGTSAPGFECALASCTGVDCQLSYSCATLTPEQLYLTASSPTSAFAIDYNIITVDTTDISYDIPIEGLFVYEDLEQTGWNSPNLKVYHLNMNGINVMPYQKFEVTAWGTNQGTVDMWLSVDRVTDKSCAAASLSVDPFIAVAPSASLRSCDLASTKDLYITVAPTSQPACGVDLTYALVARVVDEPWSVSSTALTSGKPVTMPITYEQQTTVFKYSLGSVDPTTVVSVSLTHTNPTPERVTGTVYPYLTAPIGEIASSVDCSYALNTNAPTFFSSCQLLNVTDLYFVIESAAAFTPDATYTLTVTKNSGRSLAKEQLVAINATSSGVQQYSYLSLDETSASSWKSLSLLINMVSGTALTVDLYDGECASTTPLSSFECFTDDCVVPFQWASELHPNIINIVTTTQDKTYYNVTYTIGKDNCQASKDDLSFCSGVKYDWWRYGNDAYLDDAAAEMFDKIYQTFCPDCDCRRVSAQCNETLTRFACEYTLRPCDSNGFQTTMCRSTCTDVEEACGMTFTQAGWELLECGHNWYASSSEKACQSNGFVGFTSSSSGIASWIWWVLIVIGALVLLLLLLLLLVAFVKYVRKPRTYETIDYANGDEAAPIVPSEAPPPPPPATESTPITQ